MKCFTVLALFTITTAYAQSAAPNIQTIQQDESVARSRFETLVRSEIKRTEQKLNQRGMEILSSNPELYAPAAVIGVGAALWTGRSVPLTRSEDFTLSTRLEGRSRSGGIEWQTPYFVDGKFNVSNLNQYQVGLTRALSIINTQAELLYGLNNQAFSTRISHQFAKNFSLSVGSSRIANTSALDSNAGISYQRNF